MKIKRLVVYGMVVIFLAGSAYVVWRRPSIDGIRRRVNFAINAVMALVSPLENDDTIILASIPFDYVEIDSTISGDVKLVGDIDGDGFLDLVMGGSPGEKLNWYRYPGWEKTVIATPNTEFTTDGALGDVDSDGDLDVVVPDGPGENNLLWFENPLPNNELTDDTAWQRHAIGSIGDWGKDVELADFDGDGRLDVATRDHLTVMIYFQTAANTWSRMAFSDVELGSEGMASGDVDGNGFVDLVLRGVWLRNPGETAAQIASNWTQYTIGSADTDFKALVVDLNQDGQMDVMFSSSENIADVDWWSPDNGDPTGSWTKHTIVPNLERTHTLQTADMDLDGDIDVVLGQMHTSAAQEIMVMLNVNGDAATWEKKVVGTGGLHNGVVADIGNDGDYDIYGANWTGNPPVKLWENRLDAAGPVDRWTYRQITNENEQTFGLGFGDVDSDGNMDIVSGRYWYRNPGDGMLAEWAQVEFPSGMQAFMVLNVDGDTQTDVLAQKEESGLALYWLEATDAAGREWASTKIGSVESASHELGAQGYRTVVFNNTRSVFLISSGNGVYYFEIPANPDGGNWPKVHINSNPSDEGFAVGDIDGDGQVDIAGTTGDSKRVEWYRNPGDGSGEWSVVQVGSFEEAIYPDRTELADLNGDGRLDIIVTEENGGEADAQTIWWEQPADPTGGNWTPHPIVTQATTNSLDVADMDADGDIDLILGEHRGSKKLTIWLNDGRGNFTEKIVDQGKESHLGGQVVDLDGDGDLDIVSIAWDEFQLIHMWRNDELAHLNNPSADNTANLEPTPLALEP